MDARPQRWLAGLCALMLAGTGLPVQALGLCSAPAQAEARKSVFDPDGLFSPDGAELSTTGRLRLSALARSLGEVEVEAVVVSVAAPSGANARLLREAVRRRAESLRQHLQRSGLPADRVYLEQRRVRTGDAALAEPVLIETIAAWRPAGSQTHAGTCLGATVNPAARPATQPG